jgi:hypothetical protein
MGTQFKSTVQWRYFLLKPMHCVGTGTCIIFLHTRGKKFCSSLFCGFYNIIPSNSLILHLFQSPDASLSSSLAKISYPITILSRKTSLFKKEGLNVVQTGSGLKSCVKGQISKKKRRILTDRQTNIQAEDRKIDSQTVRQSDRHTDRQIDI